MTYEEPKHPVLDPKAETYGYYKSERRNAVKTLDDVKADMSGLYEELKAGTVEVKLASELANITGKYLKAEQLKLAREIFSSNQGHMQIGSR